MKYSEFESIKKQFDGYKEILKKNRCIRFVGSGSKKIEEQEAHLKSLESQLQELIKIPQIFNSYFSDRGWISYDFLSMTLMKNAIEKYEDSGIDDAEELIINHYKPENLEFEIMRTKALPALLTRYKLIEYAMVDYLEERYYSVVPLLLMVIDGAVNDILGKDFHTDMTKMDVWNSLRGIDNGLDKICDIFRKGRNKLRTDEISLPYRNGILYGMDIGYDNLIVAAKCWHFLFVIRDWGLSKQSEKQGEKNTEKSQSSPA